jgi:REP element-mobilizing transposase RayT
MLVEIMQDISLPSLVKWWKGSSAHKANKILQRSGTFWHRDYFDRYIRDEAHYYSSIEYIHMNPVKAGLIDRPQNWRFSSAWEEPTEVGAPHKE